MSYNVTAYKVSSERIKSLWGSGEEELVDLIITEFGDEVEEQIEALEIDLETYSECFKDIINGKINNLDESYVYGYIYEILCSKFGEVLEYYEFMPFLEDVTSENHKAFIPIPSNDDWPEFYSIALCELEAAREIFLSNKKNYASSSHYLESIKAIFNSAIESGSDLVFFGY